jgi:uncharacterized membrane protein
MKSICNKIASITAMILLTLVNVYAFAQENTGGSGSGTGSSSSSNTVTTETTTTSTTEWYAQPWVWIVGGAVFIIILIALLRGNSSSDRSEVSRSTTVVRDDR